MLLFKGISGDLDHWVLGDSFLKYFYLVFDADNFKIGIMTNQLNFGGNYEELVLIDKPRQINILPAFISMIIVTFIILLTFTGYKIY